MNKCVGGQIDGQMGKQMCVGRQVERQIWISSLTGEWEWLVGQMDGG